ncbi:MAG: N-acetylglucosamine-6-phosphate deacetylase [Erysipelotrichaceae bacterium]
MKTLIYNGHLIIDGDKEIPNGCVLIENKKIIGIYENEINLEVDQKIDAGKNYVIPGLLDMHTHGSLGYDFNECNREHINKISDCFLSEGVTGFLASLVCEKEEDYAAILKRYEDVTCPNLIGIHMEGPFLNIEQKAVMKEDCLRDPDEREWKHYLELSSKIKSMTIAPELTNANKIIQDATKQGIIINIGHSNATCEEALFAQKDGATGITHLYNAMSQHNHRAPGLVTAAFLSNYMCELIVDGFHIHPDIIKATYQILGRNRITLISDANPCKGLADGNYSFSGKNIIIKNGEATVKETGRIAGSTLSMPQACRNMMKYCNCDIKDVVQMAAVNPSLQYHLKQGKLAVGYEGNAVIVNKEFEILSVINQDQILQYK